MVAAVLSAMALRGTPDLDPVWSRDGSHIAFARQQPETPPDASASIWIVGRNGTGLRRVTPAFDPTYYSAPTWSPNGEELAFQESSRYSATSTLVERTDGSVVAHIDNWGSASWSPDGTKLALGAGGDVALADVGVWQPHGVTIGEGVPSWSPDSKRFVYALRSSLAVLDVATGSVTRLPAPSGAASWSPNGAQIAYTWGCGVGVVRAAATGPPATTRTCGGNNKSTPSWSPVGKRFTYSRCANVDDCGIYVASATHPGRAVRIASGRNPDWSPDGRRIAYERWVRNRLGGIWLIYPNGRGARPLLR
jgi:Tol biopolymer transport system component